MLATAWETALADALRRDMTVEEFLAWNLNQEPRYELVDGVPVPLRAMAGVTDEHDTIAVNLVALVRAQLRGTGCRVKTPDTALRTAIRRVRRPDATIECSAVEKGSLEARNPVAVFEILSPTTRKSDRTVKLQEYQRHPLLKTIVHIDPDVMDVLVFQRDENGQWTDQRYSLPIEVVTVSGTNVSLSLAAIYEDVPLPT